MFPYFIGVNMLNFIEQETNDKIKNFVKDIFSKIKLIYSNNFEENDLYRYIQVMSNPRVSDNIKERILNERNINFSLNNNITCENIQKEIISFIHNIKEEKINFN